MQAQHEMKKFPSLALRFPADKKPEHYQIIFAYQSNSYYIVDISPVVWE